MLLLLLLLLLLLPLLQPLDLPLLYESRPAFRPESDAVARYERRTLAQRELRQIVSDPVHAQSAIDLSSRHTVTESGITRPYRGCFRGCRRRRCHRGSRGWGAERFPGETCWERQRSDEYWAEPDEESLSTHGFLLPSSFERRTERRASSAYRCTFSAPRRAGRRFQEQLHM
ncbi:hypothetical protein [Streptomyces sp. NBC_00893]|uniref:hypothetical protein n=1 Tax=Streptomyces sp. NBC_00893 TaxID=2975862 RepID=UPI00225806EF|nr:hypothetical protein [Streptomyces sp. NBC_00893]